MFGNLQTPAPSGQSGGFGTCLHSFRNYYSNSPRKARLTILVRQVRLVNLNQLQVLARFRGARTRSAVPPPLLVRPQTRALASSVNPPLRPLAPRLGVQVLLEQANLRPQFSVLQPASSFRFRSIVSIFLTHVILSGTDGKQRHWGHALCTLQREGCRYNYYVAIPSNIMFPSISRFFLRSG
jgi:hypothetical protein